jgi:CRISPR/Cas system-associated protein Cas5 (RAMP superfamily)
VTEGLAATQVEKLRTLAEGIEFTDSESYVKKLNILKGKYFSEKKEVNTGVITEEASEGLNEEAKPAATGEMANYVSAISRTKTKNF